MKRTPLKVNRDKVLAWKQRSKPLQAKKGLTTKTTLKAKKPMRKVGKIGRANIAANKKIAAITEDLNLTRCEICALHLREFEHVDCTETFTLGTAHRHKRAYYKGDPELLSDPNQWVKACVGAHDTIEHNEELTEKVFNILRGPEATN